MYGSGLDFETWAGFGGYRVLGLKSGRVGEA